MRRDDLIALFNFCITSLNFRDCIFSRPFFSRHFNFAVFFFSESRDSRNLSVAKISCNKVVGIIAQWFKDHKFVFLKRHFCCRYRQCLIAVPWYWSYCSYFQLMCSCKWLSPVVTTDLSCSFHRPFTVRHMLHSSETKWVKADVLCVYCYGILPSVERD